MIKFKKAKNGQHHFSLKAGNNEIVATSEMYETKQGAKNGADAVYRVCGKYWALAFATLIEEKAQACLEDEGIQFTYQDASSLLMSLDNEALQNIVDRIPYENKAEK